MLALMEHLLKQKVLHPTLEFYSEIVLKMILFPTLGWKSGGPSTKIRKAGLICFMQLIDQNLISPAKLYSSFKETCNLIKGTMDDDWCNDLRFAATIAMRRFLQYTASETNKEDFIDFYADILKRMDDAQDQIRLETCKTMEVFFDMLPEYWSSSLYPYTVKAVFIHLDDPSNAIQDAVTKVLQKAARVQTKDFLEVAQECYEKHSHPALCKNLIDYAQENYACN